LKLVERLLCWLAISLAIAGGCSTGGLGPDDNPTMVTDVTGVAFGWRCDSSSCNVALAPATPPPDPCTGSYTPGYGEAWGRFFEVCSVCAPADKAVTYVTTPGQCRVLACATAADCPIIFESSPPDIYECVDGLCENADQARWPRVPLARMDAEELCFAVHERSETRTVTAPATMQIEADLDANCAGTGPHDVCTLPVGCRAP